MDPITPNLVFMLRNKSTSPDPFLLFIAMIFKNHYMI